MAITAEPIISSTWWEVPERETEASDNLSITGETENKAVDSNVFKVLIKPLNSMELLEIRNHLRKTIHDNVDFTARGLKRALEMGLEDWMNFEDADGKEVPFSIKNAESRLPYDVLSDIAYRIITVSSVPEAVRKKL